jgi:hypothetical protein
MEMKCVQNRNGSAFKIEMEVRSKWKWRRVQN